MKITSVELRGFRGFPKRQSFDCDADVVVVIGANGQGKTSLFDGVLWALTGEIPRLGKREDRPLVSLYSSSGDASVSLGLRAENGEHLKLSRSYDGATQHLKIESNGQALRGHSARGRLIDLLWPDALVTDNSETTLCQAITRSVYLQQDLVRQFIDTDSEQSRFNTISELVGIGRITELQLQLEKQKAAWSRASNILAEEAALLRGRRDNIGIQFTRLAEAPVINLKQLNAAWKKWWQRTTDFGSPQGLGHSLPSAEAPALVDLALKELTAFKRNRERQGQSIAALLSEMKDRLETRVPETSQLQAELATATQRTQEARELLTVGRNRAAEERRIQVELHERQEELRILANLALRHLEEQCPVCMQDYDREKTRRRLEQISGSSAKDLQLTGESEVSKLAVALEDLERAESEARISLQRAEQARREHEAWMSDCRHRLNKLSPTLELNDDAVKELKKLARRHEEEDKEISETIEEGERLSLLVARTTEQSRRAELQRSLKGVDLEVERANREIDARNRTGDIAGNILSGLREANFDLVEARLQHIEPLLQRIYARIDPHPAFRVVRFLTSASRGRGHLATLIQDPLTQLQSSSPSTILSSSQMNALAVALFLSFNLGMPSVPLKSVILDDPLQSLDDVNLLGLVDLLRRTKDQRQLIVSTHDKRFGELLVRKLRPVNDSQTTKIIELEAWDREGPRVFQSESPRDLGKLRIVA